MKEGLWPDDRVWLATAGADGQGLRVLAAYGAAMDELAQAFVEQARRRRAVVLLVAELLDEAVAVGDLRRFMTSVRFSLESENAAGVSPAETLIEHVAAALVDEFFAGAPGESDDDDV